MPLPALLPLVQHLQVLRSTLSLLLVFPELSINGTLTLFAFSYFVLNLSSFDMNSGKLLRRPHLLLKYIASLSNPYIHKRPSPVHTYIYQVLCFRVSSASNIQFNRCPYKASSNSMCKPDNLTLYDHLYYKFVHYMLPEFNLCHHPCMNNFLLL